MGFFLELLVAVTWFSSSYPIGCDWTNAIPWLRDRVTVLIDVRRGAGWPNPPVPWRAR